MNRNVSFAAVIFSTMYGVISTYAYAPDAVDAIPVNESVDKLVDALRDGDVETTNNFNHFIQHLGTIRETGWEWVFYARCLEEIENNGTTESLPALESLLNRQDVWPLVGEVRSDVSEPFAKMVRVQLFPRASNAWYAIRWREATLEERIETAYFGLKPDAPVRIDPDVSRDRVLEIGPKARPELVRILLNPKLTFVNHPLLVNAVSNLVDDILTNRDFELTDEELEKVLAEGGTYGQYVVVRYLSKHYADPRALPVLRKLIQDASTREKYLFMYSARYYKDDGTDDVSAVANAIANDAEKLQSSIIDAFSQSPVKGRESLDLLNVHLLHTTIFSLSKLGPSETSKKAIVGYMAFRETLDQFGWRAVVSDLIPHARDGILMTIDGADRVAREAAEAWGLMEPE